MTSKLTDTQLVLMSAAAQRDDSCLVASQSLKGGAARKVADKLIDAGFVREIKAKAGLPVWRRDEETGIIYALKLTAAGLKAIAVDDEEPVNCNRANPDVAASSASRVVGSGQVPYEAPASAPAAKAEQVAVGERTSSGAPRSGSKLALVIGMLQREEGATLTALAAATGWLPHTTRAALTGLRKRDYVVSLDRSDKDRGSIYRIAARAGEGGAGAGEAIAQTAAPTEPAQSSNARRSRRRLNHDQQPAA